ncbi:MAG: hypothetical protein M9909_09250 [Thermomicrobiales bacterium]|nr:hypothetical protein [Thermomicrobiales bacterium]
MDINADTFLTTVYVIIDDFCARHLPPVRPGPKPIMSDSEVLTIQVVKTWHGSSERGALAWIAQTYAAYFPHVLSPSAFNRRAHALAPKMALLQHDLVERLRSGDETCEIIDGLPIPLASPVRGQHRRCFTQDEADIGRCSNGKSWYYGVEMMTAVTASGVITGFVTAPARNGERWMANALYSWRADPTVPPIDIELAPKSRRRNHPPVGPGGHFLSPTSAGTIVTGVYLADGNFTGDEWQQAWKARCGATVITQDTIDRPLIHWFHDARQRVETVFAELTTTLHIKNPLVRSEQGLVTHLVSTCTAFNLGIYINRTYDRDDLRIGTLFRG